MATLLIDIELVRKNAWVQKSLSNGDIETALELGQDVQLETLIGTALFDRIISEKESGNISAPVQELFDGVLTKLLIYYTISYLVHTQRIKISAQATVKKSGDNAEAITLAEVDSIIETIASITARYENKLMAILEANPEDFPELVEEVDGGVSPDDAPRTGNIYNTREMIAEFQAKYY